MKIAYLYYDFLNLYGESGNIKIISKILKENRIKHKILYLSLNEELNFKEYDLVYIASGTEENMLIALDYLKKYKEDIRDYILDNKFFLATGNSVDLFGSKIIDNNIIDALGIFDYEVEKGTRKKEEVYINGNIINKKILGFINNDSYISKLKYPLFDNEGIHYNNFYGTYIIGPLLVRNPRLLTYIANNVIKDKDPNFKLGKVDLKLENKAYKTFLENSYKEYVKN